MAGGRSGRPRDESAPGVRVRRRIGRVLLPLAICLTVLTGAGMMTARAGFVASTTNSGSSIAADTLQPPTGLAATAPVFDTVDLTWTPTPSTFADGYVLARSTRPGGGYVPAATVPGQPTASHTDTPVQPGTIHYYIAQATAGSWLSAPSNEASVLTPGLPGALPAGPWGTGLSHAADPGTGRGLILVAGNEQDPHVRPLGAWQTGLGHVAEPGPERLLVLVAGNEHASGGPAPQLTSVTYGGQAMTRVNRVRTGTGSPVAVELWILDEAGIAAATDSTFVPTWNNTPDWPMYSHAFYASVDQTTPIADEDTARTNNSTPNPITTSALTSTAGDDYVVTAAVSGNAGAYTPQNGFTLGIDQTAGATTTLGTADMRALTTAETPSMQHSNPNKQAITGAVLNSSATPFAPTLTNVTYGGQPMTKLTGVSVGSLVTASTEIWYLGEAGIAAAADGTFVPTWSSPPDLPMYAHRFYRGVDQSNPVGATGVASSDAPTPNPITTPALPTTAGDIVVIGAHAGNAGSYTPQNGFVLGTNQTASSSTLGTADKIATGGSETPSMQHDGPNRQVISGVVLRRARAQLSGGWTTGLTHAAGAGNQRLLLFVAAMENGADPGTPPQGVRDLTAVTYGGQALTAASDVHICTANPSSSFCVRAELWYLLESGIAAATDSTFVPTWSGDPPHELEEMYAAVTIDGVDQAAPLGNVSTGTSTANPIQPAHPVGVGVGDITVVVAAGGMQGSYTPQAGYTEATDQTLLSSTLATAFRAATSDGTEQPSMSFDLTINRQVVLAATVKTAG